MSDQPIIVIPQDMPVPPVHYPHRFLPWATYFILALNFLVLLLMTLAGGSTNPEVLIDFGASYAPYVHRGEYWRLVTPMFLHIGLIHLMVNSFALFVLGTIFEQVYGYGRFCFIYVISGVGSSFLSMSLSEKVSAGASGAIMGIAGAMLVAGYVHRHAIPPRWRRAFGRGIIPGIVLTFAFGLAVRIVDNWGHLGGMVTGMVLAALIPPPQLDLEPSYSAEQPSQALVIVPVVIVGVAMAAAAEHYRASRVVTRLLDEGRKLNAQKQDSLAVERFREAARRAPRDERPHEALGSLYLDQKRVTEGIQEFEQALKLNPDSPRDQLALFQAYREKGDLAKAQQYFEAAVGKNPRTAEGNLALADLLAEQKLYAEAIERYGEALRLSPNLATAHNNLAWLYATCDDPKYRNPREALEHARRAVEQSEWKQAEFVDTLAEALYVNQSYQEAVKVQTRALQLDPNNRELQEHMARYRKAAGA